MNWKFWKKQNHNESSASTKEAKLTRPKELPDRVGRYLVTQLNEDPDWVWGLKCTLRLRSVEKNVFEIRIFNPHTAEREGVSVVNFNSLDDYPELILFTGSFNKNTGSVHLSKTMLDAA
jgi:hypothetical protein